ncbi:MAG: phytoene/squalene synthase family protein [Verrucomicrobia bacterium]|nr:phytoene/squalene synthase family protein [Verrucomicrobiota bacterium]
MATNSQDQEVIRLLHGVSRSFYLTVRVLPHAVRSQIGLAYLLARAADTIADTDAAPLEERLHALDRLRERILDPKKPPPDLKRFVAEGQKNTAKQPPTSEPSPHSRSVEGRSPTPSEADLLAHIQGVLRILDEFPIEDQNLIRAVLSTITSGQELDLQRFGRVAPGNVVALENDVDLDDYTYRVAGCVGEFWTKLCRGRLFPHEKIDNAVFLRNGIRFGKGLQLVNVLRDLPRDLRLGRCYLPLDRLALLGVAPAELLDRQLEPKIRSLYDTYLDRAREHLRAGWDYTLAIPYRCVRLRLACAWPILIGMQTLAKLGSRPCLDPELLVKVSRSELRSLIIRSSITYPLPWIWKNLCHNAETSPSKPIASKGIFQ